MRADNSHHIVAAARRRSQAARRRALAALRRMDNAGLPITIEAVAREAAVSRSWLYSQPDLRAEIDRLRQRPRPAARHVVPERQRGSDASLLRRLELATQRIRELDADNKRLRHALAEALGERRAQPARRDTPSRRVPPATQPRPATASPTPSATQTGNSKT
jgi:hypothetical protein